MIWVPEAIGDSCVFEIIMGMQYNGVPDPPYGGQALETVEEPMKIDVTVTVVVSVLF